MYVHTRRTFAGSLGLGAAAFSTPVLFAETLAQTVRTGEGPFYPDKMPLDTDNDLLIVNDSISKNGRRIFTTQMHVKGHPDNARDFILNGINAAAAETVVIDFKKMQGSKTAELSANFDIVMGYTAAELENGSLQGGIGKPEGLRPR